MAKASDLDVAYVSKLARLNLTDQETQLFQKQLADVLKYAEKLREVDVSHVEAAAHAIPVFNVFREDEPRDWFTADEALRSARESKTSNRKSTPISQSISTPRLRKPTKQTSIFRSAACRLRSKTSSMSKDNRAHAGRRFSRTIDLLTTRP